MRRHAIRCALIALYLAASAQAIVILPVDKPKPQPDPTAVINIGTIQLDPQEAVTFVCPEDPAWACIGSVRLEGRLPNSASAGISVWLDCTDSMGATVAMGQEVVVPREFVYERQVPSWAMGTGLCIQNLSDKQVVIANTKMTITYAPDPSTVALLAMGAAMLLLRRKI